MKTLQSNPRERPVLPVEGAGADWMSASGPEGMQRREKYSDSTRVRHDYPKGKTPPDDGAFSPSWSGRVGYLLLVSPASCEDTALPRHDHDSISARI